MQALNKVYHHFLESWSFNKYVTGLFLLYFLSVLATLFSWAGLVYLAYGPEIWSRLTTIDLKLGAILILPTFLSAFAYLHLRTYLRYWFKLISFRRNSVNDVTDLTIVRTVKIEIRDHGFKVLLCFVPQSLFVTVPMLVILLLVLSPTKDDLSQEDVVLITFVCSIAVFSFCLGMFMLWDQLDAMRERLLRELEEEWR